MATVEQALAVTLRALRQQQGITQSAVARQINTSQAAISNWEKANRIPSPTHLSYLSSVYNTTPAKIYERSETNDMQERAKRLEQKIISKDKYGNRNKNKKNK